MYTLSTLVLLFVGLCDAMDANVVRNLDRKTLLRFMRRDQLENGTFPLLNSTTSSTSSDFVPTTSPLFVSVLSSSGSSISATTTTSLTSASSLSTTPPPVPPPDFNSSDRINPSTTTRSASLIIPPTPPQLDCDPYDPDCTSNTLPTPFTTPYAPASIEATHLTNASAPRISTRVSTSPPPRFPSFTGVFTNSSTSIDLNTTTPFPTPTCTGSVTYYGYVPPTVYVTVTEGFDVTVTASNVSVSETPTLITPLPACSETVMPLESDSLAASFQEGTNNPEFATATATSPVKSAPPSPPGASPQVGSPPDNTPLASNLPAGATVVYSSVDYTSTVVVTKKTPVTVVVPATSTPGLDFNIPTQTPSPPDNGGKNNGGGDAQGSAPNVQSISSPDVFASINNGAPESTLVVNTASATSRGLGNIIASVINSRFQTVAPATPVTAPAVTIPSTTAIGGVPVIILSPGSAVIGGQTVAIPNLVPTTVQVSGTIFTVGPSEIIAPSATLTIVSPERQQVVTPVPTATITTTIDGLTLTVGPTAAIISGTTYRIGPGAPATTVTVQGTRVSIGANGVGLPTVTVPPGGVTGSPFAVYTTQGLTFTVGSTIAIVGGTTYRVGSNALEVTRTIGPDHVTVSFGPQGVGLARTTLAPGGSPFVVVTAEGLTFTVDGTEAIISGTTYRIGTNAPQLTTSIGSGHASITFGPGGVGLRSTTILPATATSPTAETGSRSTSVTASPTQTTASGNGGSSCKHLSRFGACGLAVLSLLWLGL